MPAITVKFHIEAMCKDIVCMSYDCGTAASLMIAGVVAYLEEKIPSGIEVNTTDKRVNIYPQRFKQAEKALEYVAFPVSHLGRIRLMLGFQWCSYGNCEIVV